MIVFGQTQDILIADTKRPKNFGIKKFIPVFGRKVNCWSLEKGLHEGKRSPGDVYWIGAQVSPLKMSWVVFRLQVKHRGQKDFFEKLFGEKNAKRILKI